MSCRSCHFKRVKRLLKHFPLCLNCRASFVELQLFAHLSSVCQGKSFLHGSVYKTKPILDLTSIDSIWLKMVVTELELIFLFIQNRIKLTYLRAALHKFLAMITVVCSFYKNLEGHKKLCQIDSAIFFLCKAGLNLRLCLELRQRMGNSCDLRDTFLKFINKACHLALET